MSRPNIPIENPLSVGSAIAKLFDDPNVYRVVLYGDGSGHVEDTSSNHNQSWHNWNSLAEVLPPQRVPSYIPVQFRANYQKFAHGTRVREVLTGKVGVVRYFDMSDGMVKVLFDNDQSRDMWRTCSMLELESAPFVENKFAANFLKYPLGSRVTSIGGGHVGESGVVTYHDPDDGMVKVKFDGHSVDNWKNVSGIQPEIVPTFKVGDDVRISDGTSLHHGERAWVVYVKEGNKVVVMPECGTIHTAPTNTLTKL